MRPGGYAERTLVVDVTDGSAQVLPLDERCCAPTSAAPGSARGCCTGSPRRAWTDAEAALTTPPTAGRSTVRWCGPGHGAEIELRLRVSHREALGNAFISFHFREAVANLLTIDEIDPTGKIPELKWFSWRSGARSSASHESTGRSSTASRGPRCARSTWGRSICRHKAGIGTGVYLA